MLDEIEMFLTENRSIHQEFSVDKQKLALLVDMTTYLDKFNITVQGIRYRCNEIFTEIKSLQLKMKLFISQFENKECIITLQSLLTKKEKQRPSNIFIESLKVLYENFLHRFQNFYAREMDLVVFENHHHQKFVFMKTPNNLQLELIDLQSNNKYKNNFGGKNFIVFYLNQSENNFFI